MAFPNNRKDAVMCKTHCFHTGHRIEVRIKIRIRKSGKGQKIKHTKKTSSQHELVINIIYMYVYGLIGLRNSRNSKQPKFFNNRE
jgi:hypothetical protein